MNYIDTGGELPILICVHGLSQTTQSWQRQMELSKHYRLIIVELRGHGKSTVTEDISLHTFVQDILNILHRLNISSANFLGVSLGGIIVQDILRSNPSMVESIILSNTTAYVPYHLGMKVVEEGIKNLETMTDEEYIRELVKHCLHDKDNEQLVDELRESFFLNRDTYAECAKAAVGVNYLPTLAFNTKPTLIIGSLNDKVTPYINALTMKMYCPFAKLKLFKSGHIPNVENWQEWNESVLNFLNENE